MRKNKGAAHKAWKRLSEADKGRLEVSIPFYVAEITEERKVFAGRRFPYLATFINGEVWAEVLERRERVQIVRPITPPVLRVVSERAMVDPRGGVWPATPEPISDEEKAARKQKMDALRRSIG
jgi:hypothetical protein